MTRRRVGFLGFDGVQSLNLVGPADAFTSNAFDTVVSRGDQDGGPYEVVIIGVHTRRFTTSAGIVMHADTTLSTSISLDTLIVPGGKGLRRLGVAEAAARWIAKRAPRIRRIASVCTGIYGLAPTGLLDGRHVTTHWSAVGDVQRRFPRLQVDPDAIFLKDGPFYTSAEITAGIDFAMVMIREDCWADAALAVAREMVVYLKRPGGSGSMGRACLSGGGLSMGARLGILRRPTSARFLRRKRPPTASIRQCSLSSALGWVFAQDGVFGTPKTEAGCRRIPLSQTAWLLLDAWKQHAKRNDAEGLIFATWSGKPIAPNNVLRRWIFPACDALQLKRATWLTFRRTYSSWAHDKGVPGKIVAELMGHAKVDTTLNIYTQVIDASVRTAVAKVGDELFTIVHRPAGPMELTP